MSLRARVLAGVALIAVVLAVVTVVITETTRANLLRQVDAQLAGAVAPVQGFDLGFGRRPFAGPARGESSRLTSLYVGQVDGRRVRTIVAPNLSSGAASLPSIDIRQAIAGAGTREPFTVGSDRSDLRYRALSFHDDRVGVIVLALPIAAVDSAVASLLTVEALGGAIVVATLVLVAWWVVHLGVRPVKRMTSVATAIAGGDFSQRVPPADPRTEAGALGLALNEMLGTIEAAFDERARADAKLRQFVADASHELRTPVATIRGYAELYRSGGLADPGELSDAMRRTEQEAVRMGSLVDDLLHLARLDQGRPLESEPVDLTRLAEDAASDARAVDPSRTVDARSEGPVVVIGDESRLRQVIANVVGNALVHTPPGTPVEILTGVEHDSAVVAIVDHGPGMAADVAARAFERFYRADPARSRHRGGSGLGLAIVEATVKAHGGATTLRPTPGGGTRVRIELPLPSSDGRVAEV